MAYPNMIQCKSANVQGSECLRGSGNCNYRKGWDRPVQCPVWFSYSFGTISVWGGRMRQMKHPLWAGCTKRCFRTTEI